MDARGFRDGDHGGAQHAHHHVARAIGRARDRSRRQHVQALLLGDGRAGGRPGNPDPWRERIDARFADRAQLPRSASVPCRRRHIGGTADGHRAKPARLVTEPAMPQWRPHTFAQSLAAAAAAWPDQEAMVAGNTRLTYRRFWDDVRRTAANLKRLGLRRGDHFAICLGNSTEWAILLFAAATIGVVTVPVNTRFKADELLYCLKQADVRMLAIADRFLKIDFVAMLRSICPALDGQLPDPGLPLLRTVLV